MAKKIKISTEKIQNRVEKTLELTNGVNVICSCCHCRKEYLSFFIFKTSNCLLEDRVLCE